MFPSKKSAYRSTFQKLKMYFIMLRHFYPTFLGSMNNCCVKIYHKTVTRGVNTSQILGIPCYSFMVYLHNISVTYGNLQGFSYAADLSHISKHQISQDLKKDTRI